jgi:hypothetical protein
MALFEIGGLGGITGVLKALIELFPNAEQRAKAASAIQDFESKIVEGQNETNTAEASHSSIFVAGWRPFVGWASGIGFVYGTIAQPVLSWLVLMVGIPAPPTVDVTALASLLFGMLGLGGLRSFEKSRGIDTKVIKKK